MTEKLRSVLVTDRTQADVNTRNEKGTYGEADLNRVLRACSWLAGKLEGYGYGAAGEFFPAVLIHVTVRPPGSGRAESVLAYRGETAAARAVGGSGYEFSRWEENGETVSTEEVYRFTADRDRELVAVFDVPPEEESGVVGLAVVGRAKVGKGIG